MDVDMEKIACHSSGNRNTCVASANATEELCEIYADAKVKDIKLVSQQSDEENENSSFMFSFKSDTSCCWWSLHSCLS